MSEPLCRPARRRRGGLTLIELIVVVAVIATTAGLVISRVDWVRRSADSATAAAGMAQIHSNLQMYKTMKTTYPDRFNSLLAATAVATDQPTAKYAKLFDGHGGPSQFEVSLLPAYTGDSTTGAVFSLMHNGLTKVLDHNAATAFPGDSGTKERVLDPNLATATAFATVRHGSSIEKSIYPGYTVDLDGDGVADTEAAPGGGTQTITKPVNVTLVAFGIGPGCTANGITMSSPPLCSAVDPTLHYPRFIAIFAAFKDGTRSELKAVVDSIPQVSAAQLKNYYTNVPQ